MSEEIKTCGKTVHTGSFRFSPCGKNALWKHVSRDRKKDVVTFLCGLHGSIERRRRRRYRFGKLTPLDPNGCPFCAKLMIGVKWFRACKHCSFDEAVTAKRAKETAEHEAVVAARVAAMPFDRPALLKMTQEALESLKELDNEVRSYEHFDSSVSVPRIEAARSEFFVKVVALTKVRLIKENP